MYIYLIEHSSSYICTYTFLNNFSSTNNQPRSFTTHVVRSKPKIKTCTVTGLFVYQTANFKLPIGLHIADLNEHRNSACHVSGPGSAVGIATSYGLDGPGIEFRWGEIFRTWPNRPRGPPSLLYNRYWVFPGGKERPGPDADLSPLLVPWSRKSRAISLLPLWAVQPVQILSACTRVHFTFTFYVTLSDQYNSQNMTTEDTLFDTCTAKASYYIPLVAS
jgi:hypothetical protein